MQCDRYLFSSPDALKRSVLFFLAALLSLQLFALTQHHHDLNTTTDHCAACQLGHNFTGDPPATSQELLLVSLYFVYALLQRKPLSDFLLQQRLPCPRSQAPPVI
ncbi:MAG: hypothetical protein ACYC3O_02665 [Burkholderiales bacterium]